MDNVPSNLSSLNSVLSLLSIQFNDLHTDFLHHALSNTADAKNIGKAYFKQLELTGNSFDEVEKNLLTLRNNIKDLSKHLTKLEDLNK